MTNFDFNTYISPFSWRYGSEEMRHVFSEQHKYELWRKIWVALAEAEYKAGLVSRNELNDLKMQQNNVDISRILELEAETKHDVFAAIKEFAEKAKIGGGKIHLGATSMDVVDNAETMRLAEALKIVESRLAVLLKLFIEKVEKYANVPSMGYTHLQPAEPTTVGYRFAFYTQDLLLNYELLQFVKTQLKGKGMKGAVGTAASYTSLLRNTKTSVEELEKYVMRNLGLDAALITTQVQPRQYDYLVLTVLSSIASSLAKFAGDLRILQSPAYGEWSEPFGKKQVGSSAMPFKKNPINSEKICSLARYLQPLPAVVLENATVSYLERTLDDSANRRIVIPEAFLTLDEIMVTAENLIQNMVINENRITQNLDQYAPFAASEVILMEAVKKGADRQEMHDVLKEIAMEAWPIVQEGKSNPMADLLMRSTAVKKFLSEEEIKEQLKVKSHVGNASQRAIRLVKEVKKRLSN